MNNNPKQPVIRNPGPKILNSPKVQAAPANPGPVGQTAAMKIADLEQQLQRIKESGEISPGNLENQINGMSMSMLKVANILKIPGDMHIRDLPTHAEAIMALLTPEQIAKLDAAMAARGD